MFVETKTVRLDVEIGKKLRELFNACYSHGILNRPDILNTIYNLNETFLETELENLDVHVVENDMFFRVWNKAGKTNVEMKVSDLSLDYVLDNIPIASSLEIKGSSIDSIDLSKFKKLKNLYVVDNYSLKSITGLSDLDQLKDLEFYGNISYENIEQVIESTKKVSDGGGNADIDILYYSMNPELSSLTGVMFCESVGAGRTVVCKYSNGTILNSIDKKAHEYNGYVKNVDTDLQKFAIFYELIINNVIYDTDDFEKMEKGERTKGIQGGSNSIVNGFTENRAVCEGYTHMLQYLLNMNGIRSYNVYCAIHGSEELNHSIIALDTGNGLYYSDTSFDSQNIHRNISIGYFLKTIDEISKDHEIYQKLPVKDSKISISDVERKELLDFAKKRIEEVNKRKEEISEVQKLIKEKFHLNINLNDINDLYKARGALLRIGRLDLFDSQVEILDSIQPQEARSK